MKARLLILAALAMLNTGCAIVDARERAQHREIQQAHANGSPELPPQKPYRKGFFARFLEHLGQFDREYSVAIFNAEGGGVKAGVKLSRKPSK